MKDVDFKKIKQMDIDESTIENLILLDLNRHGICMLDENTLLTEGGIILVTEDDELKIAQKELKVAEQVKS